MDKLIGKTQPDLICLIHNRFHPYEQMENSALGFPRANTEKVKTFPEILQEAKYLINMTIPELSGRRHCKKDLDANKSTKKRKLIDCLPSAESNGNSKTRFKSNDKSPKNSKKNLKSHVRQQKSNSDSGLLGEAYLRRIFSIEINSAAELAPSSIAAAKSPTAKTSLRKTSLRKTPTKKISPLATAAAPKTKAKSSRQTTKTAKKDRKASRKSVRIALNQTNFPEVNRRITRSMTKSLLAESVQQNKKSGAANNSHN